MGRGYPHHVGNVMFVLGIATLGLGFAAALIGAEGSGLLLAIVIGAIVVVWAIETAHDAGWIATST